MSSQGGWEPSQSGLGPADVGSFRPAAVRSRRVSLGGTSSPFSLMNSLLLAFFFLISLLDALSQLGHISASIFL